MSIGRRFLSIPAANPNDPTSVARTLTAMKNVLDLFSGQGRSPLDQVVLMRDLQAVGMVRTTPGGGVVVTPPDSADSGRAPASAVTNLQARGAFENILLTWHGGSGSTVAYTEIWRGLVDDVGQAVRVGTPSSQVHADPVGAGSPQYFYWARAIGTNGQPGPWNSLAGTPARTAPRSDYVRDSLTAIPWQPNHNYGLFEVVAPAAPIAIDGRPVSFQATVAGTTDDSEPDWSTVTALGQQITDGSVTWVAVDVSTAPFVAGVLDGKPVVFMPGAVIQDASIDSAKIKSLAADKIDADKLSAISANLGEISGGSMNIKERFIVDQNGNVAIRSGSSGARMEIQNNVIKVYDAQGQLRVKIGDLTA